MTSIAHVPAGNPPQHRLLRPGARTTSGAVVGVAGTGKTTFLDAVVAAVESHGAVVVRLAASTGLRALGVRGEITNPTTAAAWLLAKLGEPPWLLAIDDAHLLEPPILAAVADVARRAKAIGGGVVATYRPVPGAGLGPPDSALAAGKNPVVLGSWSVAQVAALPSVGGDTARATAIVQGTGGNPRLAAILAGSDNPVPDAAVRVVRAELDALVPDVRRCALALASGESAEATGFMRAALVTAGLAGNDGGLLPLVRAVLTTLPGSAADRSIDAMPARSTTAPMEASSDASVAASMEVSENADALLAERAWRNGDTTTAIEAADRALAAGADPDCLAASVAAAGAAADGDLFDAADRWRGIATALGAPPGSWAAGRAALVAALAGDVQAAARDLAQAHQMLTGAAPRGLTVLLDAVDAVLAAARGDFDRAARRLTGLAVSTVPADPLAAQCWDELAMTVVVAAGNDRRAREMLAAQPDRRPLTTRRRLLMAWLDLRAGRLTDVGRDLVAAATVPAQRRDAVLAAAIAIGLARRIGDATALRATWHKVAPVVAGADVELLLLDAWGELSVGAALVSTIERDTLVEAMTTAATRAGSPPWCAAVHQWWTLQRAIVANDPRLAAAAAAELAALAAADDRLAPRALAATMWASVLAGAIDHVAVVHTAEALADAGQPWEAAALCAAAASRLTDHPAAKDLLSAGRTFRAKIVMADKPAGDGLTDRERAVAELLVDSLTYREIGARLYISPKTVEQHVAKLRQKLLVRSRRELIAALRTRLSAR
jgi:DNA-binding CsgD family transcriptional regulator